MKTSPKLKITAVVIGFFMSVCAFGNTFNLLPLQSATITDENGDGVPETVGLGFAHPDDPNYGTTLVQKGSGQYPYERRSVEEFSLAGISSLQSATLTFYFYNSIGASSSFDTILSTSDGLLTLSDFSLAGTNLGTRTIPGNSNWYISFDITNAISSLLSEGDDFLLVRQQISGFGGSQVFSPQLTVTTVPEPEIYGLLTLGMMLACVYRRRI